MTNALPLLTVMPEDAEAHLRNALQILMLTKPVEMSAHEVEKCILACEVRIVKALMLMGAGQ
jgi:hypothetical protein